MYRSLASAEQDWGSISRANSSSCTGDACGSSRPKDTVRPFSLCYQPPRMLLLWSLTLPTAMKMRCFRLVRSRYRPSLEVASHVPTDKTGPSQFPGPSRRVTSSRVGSPGCGAPGEPLPGEGHVAAYHGAACPDNDSWRAALDRCSFGTDLS